MNICPGQKEMEVVKRNLNQKVKVKKKMIIIINVNYARKNYEKIIQLII